MLGLDHRTTKSIDFSGSKIAIYSSQGIITYKRDEIAGLPFAGKWDLPGGGREGVESPFECVRREVHEEFGIEIAIEHIIWSRAFGEDGPLLQFFFVARIPEVITTSIQFGTEGSIWAFSSPARFISRPDAIPQLQRRLALFLSEQNAATT